MQSYSTFDLSQPLYQNQDSYQHSVEQQRQPFYSPEEPTAAGSPSSELGAWTYPSSSSSHQAEARSPSESLGTRGRIRAATLAGRGMRRRTSAADAVSSSMSGLDLQSHGNGGSFDGQVRYSNSPRPSLDQQVGQAWSSTASPSRPPLPPQWTHSDPQLSAYPQKLPLNPRHQHHRSLSTASNDSQWSHQGLPAHTTPSSNQTTSHFRNPSDFLPSPVASPHGRMGSSSSSALRPSTSTSSFRSVGSFNGHPLSASSSSTRALDAQTSSLAVNDDPHQWVAVFPREGEEFATAVAQHHQQQPYQAPALSPSVSSNHSYSGFPRTPSAASSSAYSSYRATPSSIATSLSANSSYSTTSSSSFPVPRSRARPTSQVSSRQTYAAQAPAQKQSHKNHARARSSPSPSTFATSRTPSKPAPEIATGESIKRPEAIAAIEDLRTNSLSPFALNSCYPFIPGPKGAEKLKMKLTAEQKFELCSLKEMFQDSKQNDIAIKYGIERSTVSKIWKEKQRWLSTDLAQYTLSQHRGDVLTGSPLKPASKPTRFTELEDPLVLWVRRQIATTSQIPTDKAIKDEAFEIARCLGWKNDKFKGSTGWLENFRSRHDLHALRLGGGVAIVSKPTIDLVDQGFGAGGPSFGKNDVDEDGQVDWSEFARESDDEGDQEDVDDPMSAVGAAVQEVSRAWDRSISARSASSSSSFVGLRDQGNLPAVIEDEVQLARTQSMSRMSSTSSQGLSTSTSNSPASSVDGLRTPDPTSEADASVQITPTNQHRASLRSAFRPLQPLTPSTLPDSTTPYPHHQRGHSYPTAIPTSFDIRAQQLASSTPNSARSVSDPVVLHQRGGASYGPSPPPQQNYQQPHQHHQRSHSQSSTYSQSSIYTPDLPQPSPMEYQHEFVEEGSSEWIQEEQYSPAYEGGEEISDGNVYEDPQQQSMEYSSMPPGQFGLYPPSSDQIDYSVQHQQQSNAQPRLQPPIPQLLPGYSTYHDRTNLSVNALGHHPSLGSRSVSSSSSSSSYPISPNPSTLDYVDSSSPTIYGGISPGGGYTSPGFTIDASSKQINHAPAFHLPSQSAARTRSYTTSSLSQAFPTQQEQQQHQPRAKKISKEEGLLAYNTALEFFAQSGEPDAVDRALALTGVNSSAMKDGDLPMGGI